MGAGDLAQANVSFPRSPYLDPVAHWWWYAMTSRGNVGQKGGEATPVPAGDTRNQTGPITLRVLICRRLSAN